MLRWIRQRIRIPLTLRKMVSVRVFLIITCISLTLSIIWIQLAENQKKMLNESLIQEALKNAARDQRFAEVYRKPNKLPKDLKYMLLWTQYEFAPFYNFKPGQRSFIERNCSTINCYVTTDRFFLDDIRRYDAIAFNGRNLMEMKPEDLPEERSPKQKYIFFNLESADNYPICTETFDNFFNWTSTYRLDSDIPYPYLQIRNNLGAVIGPKEDMKWIDFPEEDIDSYKWQNKSKAVAWFVSHCSSRSGRKEYARQLKKALSPYGWTLDIYGACGSLKCPRSIQNSCDAILDRDYYFYLSFENSLSKDYVTEKLLTALQHNVVPIVLGGADYSRFLPPGSYLDANKIRPQELATTINTIIMSPEVYSQFHRWRSHYSYVNPTTTDCVCAVCEALNNKSFFEKETSYKDFRRWWHPHYKERCRA